MADHYVANQKRIIRRRISKFLPTFFVVLILLSMVVSILLWAYFPTPDAWETEDITIVDIQYRERRRYSRYAVEGYELTDENGNLYWIAGELTWPEKGQTYTVTFEHRAGYRQLHAISHNGEVLKSLEQSITVWERDSGYFLLILIFCAVGYVKLFIHLYKVCHHPEILECKKRIATYEEKMRQRALKKQSRKHS